MRKECLKKIGAVGLSFALLVSSLSISPVAVRADLTTEGMVASAQYNLALNKTATANPSNQEGSEAVLTDGKFTPKGDHAATTFGTAKTYYEVDLGTVYDASTIDKLVVGYKENSAGDTPVNGYEIQYSANGLDFTTVKKITSAMFKAQITDNNLTEEEDLTGIEGKVRFVRLYYSSSYPYGVQATEIAVLDTDLNAKEVEPDTCQDAKSVTLKTEDYNQITYNIEASDGQDGYKYLVYLENVTGSKLIGNGVEAGKDYVVDNVLSGMFWLKVVSCYDGAASEGIKSNDVMISDISTLIRENANVANAYTVGYPAQIVEMKSIYEGHTLATAQKALDGILLTGEGNTAAMRTAAGSPQYFVIDLGEYYVPSEMKEVLLAYTNNSTYASNTKVEFSLDGETYTTVGNKTGYKFSPVANGFCAVNRVPLNSIENDTDKAVRFVKITLSGGESAWGYVVNEASVIADSNEPTVVGSDIPEAADVTVTSKTLEQITYSITAPEGQEDATYVVSLNSQVINRTAKAGVEYTYENVDAGDYTLKVCTLEDGWLSKGITKSVIVDGYVNYISDSLNLVYSGSHPEVTVTSDNDNRDYVGDPTKGLVPGSQGIGADIKVLNNGVYTDTGHHTGYLQTRPDKEDATIIYDLAKDYKPTDIHSVIAMYAAAGNAATEYEISFSGDGENYERVFYGKNVSYQKFITDIVDVSEYTQDTVRYVKYYIITGNYQKHDEKCGGGCNGYNLCELAVMGDISLKPEAPKNVTAISSNYNEITVNWDSVDDSEATFNVYLNGSLKMRDVPSYSDGVNITEVKAGTYRVKVVAVLNGIEAAADIVNVTVKEEPTTAKPTEKPTEPASTEAPTTQGGGGQTVTTPTTTKNAAVSVGKTKVKKAKTGKKKVTLKLKTVKGATGYIIKYSKNKKLKKAKTINSKKATVKVKKLKKGKKYYFKAQAYRIVDGKTYYGKWSKVKASKKVK